MTEAPHSLCGCIETLRTKVARLERDANLSIDALHDMSVRREAAGAKCERAKKGVDWCIKTAWNDEDGMTKTECLSTTLCAS